MSLREIIQAEIDQAVSEFKNVESTYNTADNNVKAAVQKLAHFETNFAIILDQDLADIRDLFDTMSEYFALCTTGPTGTACPTGPYLSTGPTGSTIEVMPQDVVTITNGSTIEVMPPLTSTDILNPQAAA